MPCCSCPTHAGTATDTLAQVLIAASRQGLHPEVIKATMVALVTAGNNLSGVLTTRSVMMQCASDYM
jgi:hypothetical protein